MRLCFVKPSEPASNLFKIGAILWNRLQDVMGLWWFVCIYAAFLFSCFFLTLRPSKWSDGIISWQSWPWTNESILKKVTLACQEVLHRDGCRCLEHHMPILLRMVHNDFTNPITAVHFVPTLSPLAKQRVAGCIKSSNVQRHLVTVAILSAMWGKAWEPALAHPVTQALCVVCTENTKMRSSRFHHVFCDFALHSQICRYSKVTSVRSRIWFHIHFALQGPNHPLWRWHRSIPSLAGESQCQRSIQQHGKASRWSAGRS